MFKFISNFFKNFFNGDKDSTKTETGIGIKLKRFLGSQYDTIGRYVENAISLCEFNKTSITQHIPCGGTLFAKPIDPYYTIVGVYNIEEEGGEKLRRELFGWFAIINNLNRHVIYYDTIEY